MWSGGRRRCTSCLVVLATVVVAAQEEAMRESVPALHADPTQCRVCHEPAAEGQGPLRYGGNVLRLCQSCHDGQHAAREAHVVDVIPSRTMRPRIPSGFPLDDGRLGCLTCHDVTPACGGKSPIVLRGGPSAGPIAFCLGCHARNDYRPFNAHDQLEGHQVKADTCRWCHRVVPDVNAPLTGDASSTLRRKSSEVCRSCHWATKNHPAGGSHLGAIPAQDMIWHMSAYEMQATMRLAFPQLLQYARRMQRIPRSMPLDEDGRITCYTCHNPHERGLWPARHPRAVGAELDQAVNHRLRAHQGSMCAACHEK